MTRRASFSRSVAAVALLAGSAAALDRAALAAPLTFEERVACQRAIEEVYWRHRIWPAENPDPKPPLAEVMSDTEIRAKVERYLLESELLGTFWQRPLTFEQLQAEMDRMARQTRDPEMLRELFEALGSDPYLVAECLARPSLADRLIRSWYAHDERIHGEVRARARAELAAVRESLSTSGISGLVHDEEWTVRPGPSTASEGTPTDHLVVHVSRAELRERLTELERLLDLPPRDATGPPALPENTVSTLTEADDALRAAILREWSEDRVVATALEWAKPPIEHWLARQAATPNDSRRLAADAGILAGPSDLTLPEVALASGCTPGSWSPTDFGAPSGRLSHAAVWTGSEMIIWGGEGYPIFYTHTTTGGRYDPTTDKWTPTSTQGAPSSREGHTAVWTGSEMIVWGGWNGHYFDTGGRYDPLTDTWTATSTQGAPTARNGHAAVWTGSLMIVWGGYSDGGRTDSGARYDPAHDTWTATSTTGAPSVRSNFPAVWSGSEMLVWGGYQASGTYLGTGGRYNPVGDTWVAMSVTGAPAVRYDHRAVWTGSEMIIWGGVTSSGSARSGGRYKPANDTWSPVSTADGPTAANGTLVWSGTEMIVWGGRDSGGNYLSTGFRYTPSSDSWRPTATLNAPEPREEHIAVWTGTEMIVWGGNRNDWGFSTGGRYNPQGDTWLPTSTSAPGGRSGHTAVWTGTEMIVWGGGSQSGGRYDLGLDRWQPLSTDNSPQGRVRHTAVWTGRDMIIWGGSYTSSSTTYYVATGGRYNPATDSWTATPTDMAPRPREGHSAVWTGSEMIAWGGYNPQDLRLDSGARYNPLSNTWTSLPTTGAPSARTGHTAVWTGSEMIVWGGETNTGGKYNRGGDTWTALPTANAPSTRTGNTAVWTGSEMVVWGGFDGAATLSSGGRYAPTSNAWTPTGTGGAPSPRTGHTAIWTGKGMVVWGGWDYTNHTSTGSQYTPGSDTWLATSTDGAPEARKGHSAVWTGTQMIVWGGSNPTTSLASGGRYCLGALPGAPTASFTYSPAVPTAGQAVQFTDTSMGSPTSWSWTFGDGGSSTEPSPTHTYTAPGSYPMHLAVSNATGSDITAAMIQIATPGACTLACSATVPTTASIGSPTPFQGSATPANCAGPVTYDWDFGDGSAHATQQSPTHTYATTGTYTWRMTATAGTATCSKTGSIKVVVTRSYLVPSVAHAPGLAGTQWRTDVAAVNRNATPVAVTLTFTSYDGAQTLTRSVTLGAGATVEWQDVLVGLYGLAATASNKGTLLVETEVPLYLSSRTYNQATAGTYGQYYPALDASSVIPAGQVGVLPQIKKSAAYRTNLGLVNVGSVNVSVLVKLWGSGGAQVGSTKTMTVPARRWQQQDDIFGNVGAGNQAIAYATVEVQTEGGLVWAYASVVDNVSGDPTTIPVLVQ